MARTNEAMPLRLEKSVSGKTRSLGQEDIPRGRVRWRLHDGGQGKTPLMPAQLPEADVQSHRPPGSTIWSESAPPEVVWPVAEERGTWEYVEALRKEMGAAYEAAALAVTGTEQECRVESLDLLAEQAQDRWRTALELALHEHPFVGRADFAGARVGRVERLRLADWEGQPVRHLVFEAEGREASLPAIPPRAREGFVLDPLLRALPELLKWDLPFLFCARLKEGCLKVHAYLPERDARALNLPPGTSAPEADSGQALLDETAILPTKETRTQRVSGEPSLLQPDRAGRLSRLGGDDRQQPPDSNGASPR